MKDGNTGGFEGVVEEGVAAFAVVAGVGFVVELDDELTLSVEGLQRTMPRDPAALSDGVRCNPTQAQFMG